MATHEVLNQPPPRGDQNLFTCDPALREALRREGAGGAERTAEEFGARVGSEEVRSWGVLANRHPPELQTHDRYGHRRDEVTFHPAWHSLMQLSVGAGLHNLPWREARPGAHVARAALCMMATQAEAGHLCPIAMTYAVVPVLRKQPELAAEWEPRIASTDYDSRFLPGAQKRGALFGMAMTEKQGGSDVRANTTRAQPVGSGGEYRLTGHKWFCSAPMCDGFLVLAQAPEGLSCFFLPRFLPDGTKNHFFLQRLKDKLGNRSNASSEVEFDNAWARLVGDPGRGVRTIIDMVQHTRLDCVIGSTGLMRQAVSEVAHHVGHRAAFGRLLIEQPLMRNVLADLCVESEAATLLMMRLARSYDDGPSAAPFRRLATAIAKYWICKRTPPLVAEALECLGGAGFVEESPLPRLYRESPLNSIWEGSGNVICLDVLRAVAKEPEVLEVVRAEIRLGIGADRRFDAAVAALDGAIDRLGAHEDQARRLVEALALALQGSLLVRFGDRAVADAFCATRLAGDGGRSFGTLPPGVDCGTILQRVYSWRQ